ncbi:MAG: hypothetical protein Q8T13_10935 [Acidobacteriota bacterium]|nr:hypothetical protein [Acidobacteriota bacterium]
MTMTTYTGNQIVEPGLYYAVAPLKLTTVDERGPLPGGDTRTYYRVPMLVMLALAPLLGLAFVIFLPFIGFAMVFRLAGEKALEVGGRAATQGVRVLRPAWAPALAFLARTKPVKPGAPAPPPDPWADATEEKLDEAVTRER